MSYPKWDNEKINLNELEVVTPMLGLKCHAELKVLYHLVKDIKSAEEIALINADEPTATPTTTQSEVEIPTLVIGCSKLGCLWCEGHTTAVETKFRVIVVNRGAHRKPYYGWSFPLPETSDALTLQKWLGISEHTLIIIIICKWLLQGCLTLKI